MSNLIDPTTDSLFGRWSTCPTWCEGHIDDSVPTHGTSVDYFGPDGVVVNQNDGQPPIVSLINYRTPQVDFTPTRARLLAFQILQAADLAERYATPSVTSEATRLLAQTLVDKG